MIDSLRKNRQANPFTKKTMSRHRKSALLTAIPAVSAGLFFSSPGIASATPPQSAQVAIETVPNKASAVVSTNAYIQAKYDSLSGAKGPLGSATSGVVDISGGQYQSFKGGQIFWRTGTTVAYYTHGAISTAYAAWHGASNGLGLPISDETDSESGVYQRFQNGAIGWTPQGGAFPVTSAIAVTYLSGKNLVTLGMPLGSSTSIAGGSYQQFQNGRIYWSAGRGAFATLGAINTTYSAARGPSGTLGFPITNGISQAQGVYQQFQNGTIYWAAPSGAHIVHGGIVAEYTSRQGAIGTLGFPVSDEISNGANAYQQFQGGGIGWTLKDGSFIVTKAINSTYLAQGGPKGPLGYPMAAETSYKDGTYQQFQNGIIYWLPTTGAHSVRGGIADSYNKISGNSGPLGYPTTGEIKNGNGVYQQFQNGIIYWLPTIGAHTVKSQYAIGQTYNNASGSYGSLGYPTSDEISYADGTYQQFQNGIIYWLPTIGAHTVKSQYAIGQTYNSNHGAYGTLGYPTADEVGTPSNAIQQFQHGVITWTAGIGTKVVANGGDIPNASEFQANYIRSVAGYAQDEQRRYSVPAAVSIAQSIIESGWGQSGLTVVNHNFFGIKCPGYGSPYMTGCTSEGTTEFINGQYIHINADFRIYNSDRDSFLDHGFFLSTGDITHQWNIYYPAFQTTNDQDFVRAIARAGYATDPTYAAKIINTMDRYNLYQFDV